MGYVSPRFPWVEHDTVWSFQEQVMSFLRQRTEIVLTSTMYNNCWVPLSDHVILIQALSMAGSFPGPSYFENYLLNESLGPVLNISDSTEASVFLAAVANGMRNIQKDARDFMVALRACTTFEDVETQASHLYDPPYNIPGMYDGWPDYTTPWPSNTPYSYTL